MNGTDTFIQSMNQDAWAPILYFVLTKAQQQDVDLLSMILISMEDGPYFDQMRHQLRGSYHLARGMEGGLRVSQTVARSLARSFAKLVTPPDSQIQVVIGAETDRMGSFLLIAVHYSLPDRPEK